MKERVSMKMIAQELGVSIATVSLALRNRGPISEKTGEEIRAYAQKIGYQPNPLLASLASKRFRASEAAKGTPIAIFDFPNFRGRNAHSSQYHDPLVAAAEQLGYAPHIYTFPRTGSKQGLARELYFKMIPGIIITGTLDPSMLGEDFDWNQYSVVQCGRCQRSPNFHTTRSNIFQAVKEAFSQLFARGYQRIGCAFGRHDLPVEDDEARFGAAIALEHSYLAKSNQLPIYEGDFGDQKAVAKWAKANKPDAVIGFSPAFHWFLLDAGYEIPEELGFASLQIMPKDAVSEISGLHQQPQEVARQSVFLLDQLITTRERGMVQHPLNILVPSVWQEGLTLRPLEEAATVRESKPVRPRKLAARN